jgi:hypothetical protein
MVVRDIRYLLARTPHDFPPWWYCYQDTSPDVLQRRPVTTHCAQPNLLSPSPNYRHRQKHIPSVAGSDRRVCAAVQFGPGFLFYFNFKKCNLRGERVSPGPVSADKLRRHIFNAARRRMPRASCFRPSGGVCLRRRLERQRITGTDPTGRATPEIRP